MDFDVIIPARYRSTRLPGKALIEVGGKALIQWVVEGARRSAAHRVIVATDHRDIAARVTEIGAECCMTDAGHHSGTDRIAEAVTTLELADSRVVVNLQGDEPLMPASVINGVAQNLANHAGASMATASHSISGDDDLNDPNVVKVVCDPHGMALYFSRAPIPCARDGNGRFPPRRHIGIYAYRAGFVRTFSAWSPTALEQTEHLEQLRALEHGAKIMVMDSRETPGPGIDTPADLQRFESLVAA